MTIKTINNILCAPLKLIPYSDGWLAVDEQCEVNKGDYYYNSVNGKIEVALNYAKPIAEGAKSYPKVIAASPSLSLPVLRLPEREYMVIKLADEYSEKLLINNNDKAQRWAGFIDGYQKRAATHGYTEEDMRKMCESALGYRNGAGQRNLPEEERNNFFNKTLASLRPQVMWCEIEEKGIEFRGDTLEADWNKEYQFKSRDGKLVVIEWC